MTPFRASPGFTETWQHFDFAVDDGVATLTFNRPDKLNALTFDVYADLRDLLAELPHRGDARVLVLTGEGRGFCSGGDVEEIIGELQHMETAELLEFTRMTGAVVKALRECPLPVIAAINGVAAGAGSVIALASDFRHLARAAAFAIHITRVGHPGAHKGSANLLPPIGLATQVVDDDELPATARALARRLADGPALAYSTTKVMLTRELDMSLASAIEMEALTQALLMQTSDHREFHAAWSEGRKPAWSGR